MDFKAKSIREHKKKRGKLEVVSKMPVTNTEELSIAYTPGVAGPCEEIVRSPSAALELTSSKSTVAIVSDGTAVLGLGDIGPEAALPVMEGKAALMKEFAGIDAFPIVLATSDVDEIVETVKRIAPTFGGINLEDIAAPRCFEIERRLSDELSIPVFHDDQHGTAIVVLAGLINALSVVSKHKEKVKVVINGAGAAGLAITRLLTLAGFRDIFLVDSQGIVSDCREDLNASKQQVLDCCVTPNLCGNLSDALVGADVFIGVSRGNIIAEEHVASMNADAIIFAMANPQPEIEPDEALNAGARIVATGRSDYPNQLNNVLVFPGVFKGALAGRVQQITDEMKLDAAKRLAGCVVDPHEKYIIPDPFNEKVVDAVAGAIVSRE